MQNKAVFHWKITAEEVVCQLNRLSSPRFVKVHSAQPDVAPFDWLKREHVSDFGIADGSVLGRGVWLAINGAIGQAFE